MFWNPHRIRRFQPLSATHHEAVHERVPEEQVSQPLRFRKTTVAGTGTMRS
jgi:hypothetical protein